MNNKNLQEFISEKFKEEKTNKHCILIDCDNTSGFILGEDGGRLYLEKALPPIEENMDVGITNSIAEIMNISDMNSLEALLYDEKSEVNKKFQRYIYSDGLMNGILFDGIAEKNDCSSLSVIMDEYRERIYEFIKGIQADDDESFFVLGGKTSGFLPVRYCYLTGLTYDPLLADPRVVFFDDAIGDCVFEKKKAWKSSDIKLNTADGEKTITMKVCDSASAVTDYSDPIFMAVDDQLRVDVDGKTIPVVMPYSIKPLDCDLVEIALFTDAEKKYIRVRRCLNPTKYYDVELHEE